MKKFKIMNKPSLTSYQESRVPIVILHGWGLSGKTYSELSYLLKKEGFTVFAPDLPGFGSEPLSKSVLILQDYIDFVKNFIQKKIHGKYFLIGHSFGGRIAILLAAEGDKKMKGLILTGAAGIKRSLSLRSKIASFLAKYPSVFFAYKPLSKYRKIFRKLLYRFAGEFDYYKAGKMRATFRNIIKDDLTEYLSKIAVPTLIVWGENDTITPLCDGKIMTEKIPNSRLVIAKDASHRFPYEKPEAFVKAIRPFFQ